MRAKVLKDCKSVLKTVPSALWSTSCNLLWIGTLDSLLDWIWEEPCELYRPVLLRDLGTKLFLVTMWIHGVARMGWKESRSSGRIWAFFSHREDLKSLMSGKGHKESHPSVGSGKNDSLSFYSSRYFSPSPFSQYVNAVTGLPTSVTAACSIFPKWHKHLPFHQAGGLIKRSCPYLLP